MCSKPMRLRYDEKDLAAKEEQTVRYTVQHLLERVTRGSAQSKGIGKQALYAQIDLDQPKAYAYATEVMAATSQLPEAREWMHAFLEKRKPNWDRGR